MKQQSLYIFPKGHKRPFNESEIPTMLPTCLNSVCTITGRNVMLKWMKRSNIAVICTVYLIHYMYVYARIANFIISNVVIVLEMLIKMFSLFHWTAKNFAFGTSTLSNPLILF